MLHFPKFAEMRKPGTAHGGHVMQKLLHLLFAGAFSLYIPAQSATSVELIGVDGTFPLPIYNKWFEEYGTSHRGVRFHYLPTGSAEGISNPSSGRADFGARDVPMKDEGVIDGLD
jgi:ABC-type phosphate transport system substrate-binding protein